MLKIVIQSNADFTPPGKRSARIVETRSHLGRGRQLRWYVAGRIFREFPAITPQAIDLTKRWIAARSA